MTARIFIARHGNTFAPGEPPRRIGVRTDLPLVEGGRAQARALGEALAAAGIDSLCIHAAPLARTIETAELIRRALPGAVLAPGADWLREIDHGPDEGALESDVVDRLGADALAAWNTAATPPPGWHVDPAARIAGWRHFFATAGARDHLCVTSNGAGRFALLADPMLAAQASGQLALRTGALGLILVDAGRSPRLVFWNARPGDPPLSGL